jgi:hypothetical protein
LKNNNSEYGNAVGAAIGIRNDKVITDFFSHRFDIQFYFSFELLVTLDLSGEEIDDDGAKHIADALRTNTVCMIHCLFSKIDFLDRH